MQVYLLGDSHLARVRRGLPRIGPNVVNAAVGGSVAEDLRLQVHGLRLLPGTVVVLSIGTNDAQRGVSAGACGQAVAAVAAATGSRWIYVRPPLVEHAPWGNAVAAAVPGHIINTTDLLAPLGERAIASDGLHLAGAAYDVLLPAIHTAVNAP